jgi:restriction system protein
MEMSPTEFEHLVRQLFEAMGMEGWTTRPSNDDGVDAVVVNRTPLVGGLTIVQAKRYKDAVGVNHIRELAGAIEEKKAGHGILVTTSWFTPRSWEKAREHGRIELIDGSRLVHLINEHLGKSVLIGIKRPRTATTGPPGAPTSN